MALGSVAACGPQVVTPTPPSGVRPDSEALGTIPRPGLATDLGTSGPGVDGSGDFLSYTSELSPGPTMTAYADQLVAAGFYDAGRLGAWRVFTDTSLTLWVRVGSGGPPTSLIIRVAPNSNEVADGPFRRRGLSDQLDPDRPDPSAGTGDAGPTASTRPAISAQRPDPPHASPRAGGVGSAGAATSGGSTGSGTASGGGTSTAGSGGAGPATGIGTSAGDEHGLRP